MGKTKLPLVEVGNLLDILLRRGKDKEHGLTSTTGSDGDAGLLAMREAATRRDLTYASQRACSSKVGCDGCEASKHVHHSYLK